MTKSYWAALGIVIGVAVPLSADHSFESFLEEAGITCTLFEEVDEVKVCGVTTADGYTFKLSQTEDGYTLSLDEARGPTTPQSGNWSRAFEPTRIGCSPAGPRGDAAIRSAVASVEPILNNFLGSTDGGETAPYEFTAPFGAEQLLGPIFEVLEMSGMPSQVAYGATGHNLHTVQGKLTQPTDFTMDFKMELGVVGPCLIMGHWHGAAADNPSCRAQGLVEWQNQSCDL